MLGGLLVLGALGALGALAPPVRASPPVFCELPGQGVLRGHVPENATFLAFEGIPYALPPTGPLRFQPPQPAPRFMYRDARSQRPPCPYLNDKGVVGAEDCLYLSVFTPQVDEELKLPVLVVLPGDDWTRGYAGRWRPHRLMDQEGPGIVVVTVQSRLGALGFLSTGDSSAPGNLGLKDERLALSWVRRHINAFGGDPNRITLAGVGAGAASVMLHALSNPGLFQRAIAVSGSALSPWSLTENTHESADVPTRRLAEAVGCDCPVPVSASVLGGGPGPSNLTAVPVTSSATNGTGNATLSLAVNATASATRSANLTEMLECLRAKPVADIVYGTARLQGWAGLPASPFGPVVERAADANDSSFLTATPAQLLAEASSGVTEPRVPLLIGLSRGEGLQLLAPSGGVLSSPSLLAALDAEWTRLAPGLLAFNTTPAADRTAAAELVRRRYLGVVTPADAVDGLVRLLGDRHVVLPALRAASLHAAKHPVFLYRFAWNPAQGASPLGGPPGGSDASILLMEPSASEATASPAQRAMAMDIMSVWTSFIDKGVPSVGNTTIPSASTAAAAGAPLPFLELVRPGVQRLGNWSVQETAAFWEGLPLLENRKPSAAVSGQAGGVSPSHSRRSGSGSSRSEWPLLAVALYVTCGLHLASR
ncbi:Venom carboxylesterase-6 [Frankliniella fusca]|uniref:Venom carboxylesterase-6 n=1 Tax=Frankliniella fusca TaxID=407009 RepID=A0AAE1HU60_9NEOP|nr:Venom carboxylesterase-6 [Frankliniella fusca]